jgi:hypothetical protein
MQEQPETHSGERERWTAYVPGEKTLGENTFLKFLQRPRIVLALLMGWSLLTVVIEAVPESGLFFNVKLGDEIDGALGGGILMWQGLPLGLLYFMSFRNPQSNRSVFWVGLVQLPTFSPGARAPSPSRASSSRSPCRPAWGHSSSSTSLAVMRWQSPRRWLLRGRRRGRSRIQTDAFPRAAPRNTLRPWVRPPPPTHRRSRRLPARGSAKRGQTVGEPAARHAATVRSICAMCSSRCSL